MRKLFAALCAVFAISAPMVVRAQALPSEKVNNVIQAAMNDNYFFKDADFQRKNNTFIRMSESSARAAANSPVFTRAGATGVSWIGSFKYLARTNLPSMAIGLAVDSALQWYFSDSIAPDLGIDEIVVAGGASEVNYNTDYTPEYDPYEGFTYPDPGPAVELTGQLKSGSRLYYSQSTKPLPQGGRNMIFTMSFETALDVAREDWIDNFERQVAYQSSVVLAPNDKLDGSINNVDCFWVSNGWYRCFGMLRYIRDKVEYTEDGTGWFYTVDPDYERFHYQGLWSVSPKTSASTPALPFTCPGGYMFVGPFVNGGSWWSNGSNIARLVNEGHCQPDPNPVPGGDQVKNIGDAINDISPADLAKPLSPALLSEIVNQLWLDASMQPGYDGVPYPGWNVIDQWALRDWLNQNPDLWPTLNEFVQPLPQPSVAPEHWQIPEMAPETPPVLDLGPDPGIPQPFLEPAPTAEMIINPLRDLFPDLQAYEVDMNAGECPRPNFDAFGATYSVHFHCDLFEQNRSVLAAVMLAAFSLSSLFIVLRA